MSETYFQKGFGLGAEVHPELEESYRSRIVDVMKAGGYRLPVGALTFLLAREFGFCYGVERAVQYAYQTVMKFPDHRIFLTGEIIHNPHVNEELARRGVVFLSGAEGIGKYDGITAADVVVLPAFGVPREEIEFLEQKGCTVVDTTCGSVLNVWKNVERYSAGGYTSIIHGKHEHEETRATFSRTSFRDDAHYLVVRNKDEAEYVCRYIVHGGDSGEFRRRFDPAASPGFDPDTHLCRVGLANQTTMLSSESLDVSEMFRQAIARRYGPDSLADRFIAFDTICSATQDRQDSVRAMEHENLDVMIVIGGYNSSNTNNLARISGTFTRAFHIQDASSIGPDEICHKIPGELRETRTPGWLGGGVRRIGLTAGASTPDNQIGEAIERVVGFRDTMALLELKEFVNAYSPLKECL
jgi:4-hydroxy-3-methylbut-2-enyl diphosphate reductase